MKIIINISGGFNTKLSKEGKLISIHDAAGNLLEENKDYEVREKEVTNKVHYFLPNGLDYLTVYE